MTKRFKFIQEWEEYTDYESSFARRESGKENIRRVTYVRRDGEQPYAYLTMVDESEKRITIEQADALIAGVVGVESVNDVAKRMGYEPLTEEQKLKNYDDSDI